ncbi:DUF3817 domain-containing protein [Mycetocola tolaasinivorans]|uniref:DUF3817 domain-containing protein n=1 Tax=Mycetocola tolaasinivorans TaxID=76635 RepID=A0A3L6ZXC1_9MICO|nr:DUF3817 domain-containing protein [Mycetocola tolaasinivorans]RLP72673.1 DUF3817 domain-containing protein [Mycetocola tolaasinivorans]
MTPRRLYRIVALAEAVTWTLLIASLILKYGLDANPIVTTIAGGIHGVVFLAFALASILVGINQHWAFGRIMLGVVVAAIPYATLPFERVLERGGHLAGQWRTEPGTDPRDRGLLPRLVMWLVRHPVLFVALCVLAVAIVATVLLILGPPIGKG